MKKLKNLLTIIFLISILISPTLISKSQNTNPIFAVRSVSPQRVSETTIQNYATGTKISGNIFYYLTIKATFIFTQDTPFAGFLNIGCGLNVALVNTSAWQVINFIYNCPLISSSQTMKAGIYNSTLGIYLNSKENYNSSIFPKLITFYIHSNMNNQEYQSDDYSINLAHNITYFTLPPFSFPSNGFSNYVILLGILGIVSVSVGMVTFVVFRKYRKGRIVDINIKSFGNNLIEKLRRKEKSQKQTFQEKNLQKLEEIISENAK